MNRIPRLHSDCKGNESMQTIMIMAVGALLLMGLNKFFTSNEVGGQIKTNVTAILNSTFKFGE